AKRFHARTGADGRFAISGLPRRGRVTLQPGDGFVLAPGSAGALALAAGAQNEIGVLVAVRPASVRIRVLDRASGKPAESVEVLAIPRSSSPLLSLERPSELFDQQRHLESRTD